MPPALARTGIAPALFNSWLTQPLFTELANLLQIVRFATEQIYVSNLPITYIPIPFRALSEVTNNLEEQTQC